MSVVYGQLAAKQAAGVAGRRGRGPAAARARSAGRGADGRSSLGGARVEVRGLWVSGQGGGRGARG